MFPNWRVKLREAKIAFREGRLDEAGDLLHDQRLTEFMQGKQLSAKVAAGIVERARGRVEAGESAAGWGDLERAAALGGDERTIGALRDVLLQRGIAEAVAYLAAGDSHAALAQLSKVERRRPLSTEGRRLKEIAGHVDEANRLAERGHFSDAAAKLETAANLAVSRDTMELKRILDARRTEWTVNVETMRERGEQLFAAIENENWQDVLSAAESILRIAPKNTAAQGARRRAWNAIGLDVTRVHDSRPNGRARDIPIKNQHADPSTHPGAAHAKGDTVTEHERGERMLMWVDAVGGYLLCMGDAVSLGQPSSQSAVDVPILADLSRRQAIIRRDGGAYVLEPLHATAVDGKKIDGPVVLADGQLITLAGAVRIRFRKPHVLSATARLDFETNHKTQPSADGVILFADTCILGPKKHAHIPCRGWSDEVVLFRRGDTLACRATGPFQIDGNPIDGQGAVAPGSQVEGDDFSFSLEAIDD